MPTVPDTPPRCTFRRCPTRPVYAIREPGSNRRWYGCPEHYAAMAHALAIGKGYDAGADLIPLAQP